MSYRRSLPENEYEWYVCDTPKKTGLKTYAAATVGRLFAAKQVLCAAFDQSDKRNSNDRQGDSFLLLLALCPLSFFIGGIMK